MEDMPTMEQGEGKDSEVEKEGKADEVPLSATEEAGEKMKESKESTAEEEGEKMKESSKSLY